MSSDNSLRYIFEGGCEFFNNCLKCPFSCCVFDNEYIVRKEAKAMNIKVRGLPEIPRRKQRKTIT